MTKHHKYTLQVVWTGDQGSGTSRYDAYSRDHLVRAANKQAIEASSDPAFRGDATRHNPEELFVASLSSCHMLWYLHLCAVNGIVVTGYVDDPIGTMEESAKGSGRFTDVLLRFVVRPTRGMREHGHEHAGMLDYITFAAGLAWVTGVLVAFRIFMASGGVG